MEEENERYLIEMIKESMRQHNEREEDYVAVLREQITILKDELTNKNKQIGSLIKVFAGSSTAKRHHNDSKTDRQEANLVNNSK